MLKASQIAFLTMLVLVADVWGQSQRDPKRGREGSQTQSQPKEAQQAPTDDQRGTDKMPFSVKIISPRESEEKAAADAKTREEKMELDRKLVNFNGDLAYYTKVLVWVAALQFIALIIQCGVFALTLGATRKAANAAKESAEVAKQSLVTVQRAFVFIDSFQADVLNNELFVMPKWRNSGTTPTRYMNNWISWKPFDSEPPDDFNFPNLDEGGNPVDEKDKKPNLGFAGPNAITIGQTLTIPCSVLDAMRAGHIHLFVWGWTRYQDVFDVAHVTKFCNEIKILASWQQGEKVASAISFPIYRRHNCTDEECERQETK